MASRIKLFWACVIVSSLWPAAASGQARVRYTWSTGGLRGIRTIGGDFGRFAAGLGGLGRSSGHAAGGVLRSSLLGESGFQLRRGPPGSSGLSGMSSLTGSSPLTGQSYETVRLNLRAPDLDTSGLSRLPGEIGAESMLSIQPYLAAMGHKSTLEAEGDKPITSFVPTEPSAYRDHMERGEQSFRRGRFAEAADAFELALTFARYSPEAHLSKVHVKFALGKYNTAAYHLRKALTYFPELPLARLQVRGFYDRTDQFVNHLERLRKYVERPNADVNVCLVLAYFRYFDGAEAEAVKILRDALELSGRSKDKAAAEAVQTFWDGIAAAGEARGSLAPTTQPTGQVGPEKGSPAPLIRRPGAPPAESEGTSAESDKREAG